MSNMISSPSLIATFLFPACWETGLMVTVSFLFWTPHLWSSQHKAWRAAQINSWKNCWAGQGMWGNVSRGGASSAVGPPAVSCSAVTGRRNWTVTRPGKPPTVYLLPRESLIFHSLESWRWKEDRFWSHCFQQKTGRWESSFWLFHGPCFYPSPPACARSL